LDNIRNFRITARDGKAYDTQFYNLDVIISVGYRVKSQRGLDIDQDLQKKVLEFVLKVQGIKELPATEKIFDFALVKRIGAELEAKKWKPTP
jgi:hypothetical protein